MALPTAFVYRAWDLLLDSHVRLEPYLAEQAAGSNSPDVRIERGRPVGAGHAAVVANEASMQHVRLSWRGLRIDVADGCRVVVDDDESASDSELAQFVAAPVMGAVMTQRGRLVLHASAVRLDGHAIAFAAASGVGKSTLAALVAACGADYLSDDMVVIDATADAPALIVGPRVAKIDDGAVGVEWEALGRESLAGRLVVRPAGIDPTREGLRIPLSAVCLVEDAVEERDVDLARVRGAAAVIGIASADFGAPLFPPAARVALLRRASELALVVPVLRLRRPRRFDVAEAVVAALRDWLHGGGGPSTPGEPKKATRRG